MRRLVAPRSSRSGCGTCSHVLMMMIPQLLNLVPVGFAAFLRATLSCMERECKRATCCCCCRCYVRKMKTLLLFLCQLIRVLLALLILASVKLFRLLLVSEYLVRQNCTDSNCKDSQHLVSVHLFCYCTCFVTMAKQFWKMGSATGRKLLQLRRPLVSCNRKDCTGLEVNDGHVDLGTY